MIDLGRGEIAEILMGTPMVVTVEPCPKPLLQLRDGGILLEVGSVKFLL